MIHELVQADQCGFMPVRSTTFNLRRLTHILHETVDGDCELALVSLDLEKAFDMVEWPFLMVVMRVIGFGPVFCSSVQLLYTSWTVRLKIGGGLSEGWKVGMGTRQGCLL